MKRCPTCQKTFTDPVLSFCVDDGTPLVQDDDPALGSNDATDDWNAVEYRPPGSYVPPGGSNTRKVWPWILGIVSFVVLGIAGLAIAAAVFVPRLVRSEQSRQARDDRSVGQTNTNTNINTNTSPGVETNSNANSNANLSEEPNTPPPTDKEKVLADLTQLENEWTVANFNADKKELDRILADDYAGPGENGQIQGKAEYIRKIKRDTTVEKWNFENLQLNLRGNRATLSGRIQLIISGRDGALDFTDKFVWRGGRWQATGSEVTPVE